MSKKNYFKSDSIDQLRWKDALVDWFHEFGFTHAITLSWNRTVAMPRARADLCHLLRRCDRALIGPYFHKVPSEERTQAVFAFEGTGYDHYHVHSLWRAPQRKWFGLGKLFGVQRGIWNDIVETGSCAVDAINNGRNDEFFGYILKEQHRFSEDNLLVWADEFHPVR